MKTKDLLWGFLASMFLVGCSQNEDAPGGENGKDGKEYSYVAVNISAASDSFSRAGEGYNGGTADENKVGDAYFFFFDGFGSAFNVDGFDGDNEQGDGNEATTAKLPNNCVKHNFTSAEGGDGNNASGENDNVENSLASVLVLHNLTTSYPASVVVVLGGLPENVSATTLIGLRKCLLSNYKSGDYFIMSNSVYNNGSNNVYSTALTPAHFAKTQDEAKANPVTIHVERVAAKVVVSGSNENIAVKNTEDQPVKVNFGSGDKDVIAKIIGWDLNTTINSSYVVKDIEENTDWNTTLGFTWNNPTDYRSFWSNTPNVADPVTLDKNFQYSELKKALGAADYCMEHTNPTNESNFTKVIVKAQLGYYDAGTFTALDMAQWMGIYCLNDDLKGMVATHLQNDLYYRKASTEPWKSIAKEENVGGVNKVPGLDYIKLVRGDGDNTTNEAEDYYQATFDLVDEASLPSGIEWSFDGQHKIEADGTKTANAIVAEKLKSLAPAKIWSNGYTYYYLDIEHTPGMISGTPKVNKAVIRNHVYQINITGIVGLGTPIYVQSEDDDPLIPEVVKPTDTETFLAAQINILSWKIVNNNVVLGK